MRQNSMSGHLVGYYRLVTGSLPDRPARRSGLKGASMAHDARKEDYRRLGLRFIRELDKEEPLRAMKTFAGFGQRFATDRDSLPQTDADRAFHLVSLAADAIDYQLPFADAEHAKELVAQGRRLLDEALALDPDCFDAVRMRSSNELPSISARYDFLAQEEPRVRQACESARDAALAADDEPDRAALAADLAMRPYLRWVASMAELALICGRNRQCVDLARKLIQIDPTDISDARFTLALGLAKLEDEPALDELEHAYPSIYAGRGANDAWMLLARISLAFKQHKHVVAREVLSRLLRAYPTGAVALIRQNELPDGEFARLSTQPNSEDELVIALSESVVLLQEGNDPTGRGILGTWLVENTARLRPSAFAEARRLDEQVKAQLGTQGGEQN